MLDGSLRGTGKHHLTPIFPCGIFQLKKGVNKKPGDPNYYLFKKALESTSKRIYPNYANCDWSNQKEWKKYDIDVKESVIGELSDDDKNKLIQRLDENSKLKELLTLKISDNEILVDKEEKPYELFSTMGKRNTTAHLKSFELC